MNAQRTIIPTPSSHQAGQRFGIGTTHLEDRLNFLFSLFGMYECSAGKPPTGRILADAKAILSEVRMHLSGQGLLNKQCTYVGPGEHAIGKAYNDARNIVYGNLP